MLILEKPYVSELLTEYAKNNHIPVLKNQETDKWTESGMSLTLLDDSRFAEECLSGKRLYTTSENALSWVCGHLGSSDLTHKVELLKDKSAFRELCKQIYPGFLFRKVAYGELFSSDLNFDFPFVLKPSVGFLSAGVYVVRNRKEWNSALSDIQYDFERKKGRFPDSVINDRYFLLEEYIPGEEYAVDAYFDSKGKPVVLNIFHHRFSSGADVSDRLYCTSKNLYDKYLDKFGEFLADVNSILKIHDFPLHVEFRCDGEKVVPIEINPLRFAGFCLNELQVHISGIHPVKAFLEDIHPDYLSMWKGKEQDVFSFVVLERPDNLPPDAVIDECALSCMFDDILEVRKIKDCSVGVLATLFLKTSGNRLQELDDALTLDVTQIIKQIEK